MVVGSWDRHTVTCFALPSGVETWEVRFPRSVESVSISADGGVVAVGLVRGAAVLFDGASGEQIGTLAAASQVYHARDLPLALGVRERRPFLVDTAIWTPLARLQIGGFALLSAAFSADGVALSEAVSAGGPPAMVRGFALDGSPQWTHPLPENGGCPWLGWDEERNEWVGVQWTLDGPTRVAILRLGAAGEPVSVLPIGPGHAFAFVSGGAAVACSDGSVRSTRTAEVIGRLG